MNHDDDHSWQARREIPIIFEDLPATIRQACSPLAIVTVEQLESFLFDLKENEAARDELSVSEDEITAAIDLLELPPAAPANSPSIYASMPFGVPLSDEPNVGRHREESGDASTNSEEDI